MFEQFAPVLGRNVWLRENTSDQQVFNDTFWHGRYHCPPDDFPAPARVLDLGANIGLTAAHYQSMWPDAEIVAVEMDEACCELIALNAPGVTVRCHAVSGEGGWGSYNPDVRAEAFQFAPRQGPLAADDPRRIVSSYTLRQTILRTFGEQGVDFCKCDTESAEWGIFAHGSWAELVHGGMLVELHPDDTHPDDSAALLAEGIAALEALGFVARHHERHPRSIWAYKP